MILNFAADAVKQPQQLIYLNYFLGLGQKFDLVINIDGFNDVTRRGRQLLSRLSPGHAPGMLLKSFDVMTSVPRLDRASLTYFSRLARSEFRLDKMNHSFWKYLVPGALKFRQQAVIESLRRDPRRNWRSIPFRKSSAPACAIACAKEPKARRKSGPRLSIFGRTIRG